MKKCTHDTSIWKAAVGNMIISKCTWECQELFFSYDDSKGITHEITPEELAALEAVAEAARNGVGLDDALDALDALKEAGR